MPLEIPIFRAISEFPLYPGNSQYMISGNKTREFPKTRNTKTRLELVSLGITVFFQSSKLACLPAIGVFSNSSLEKLRRINQNHGIDVKKTIFWCSSCSWLSFRYQFSMHYMYWILTWTSELTFQKMWPRALQRQLMFPLSFTGPME